MKNLFRKLFCFLLLFVLHSSFAADVCPLSGKISVRCYKNPSINAVSLTGCFNGGLAYLCTSQITSCSAVNDQSIQNVQWTLPQYETNKVKFFCPGEKHETLSQFVSLDAGVWKNIAEKALGNQQAKLCPKDKLPLLCTQQSKGVSLIGCHRTGLSYICSNEVTSCDQVNDKLLTSIKWVQARYNEKTMRFECPGVQATNVHKHVVVQTPHWDKAVNEAQ